LASEKTSFFPSFSALISSSMRSWIRATVEKGTMKLQASADGKRWPLLRLSPFPRRMSYLVGPMCCTPERAGLEVKFSSFEVTSPNGKQLHDLTF
jgi:regulation of enolase protein 1 (concanavalin A-like superfamily)